MIRRLLIIGGSSVVRQASRYGAPAGSWLERMLARKAHAHLGRTRQQNGAHGLGAAHQERKLQS